MTTNPISDAVALPIEDFQRIVESIRAVANVSTYSAERDIARERIKVLDKIAYALVSIKPIAAGSPEDAP